MSALVWKELRENVKWALLAMLALGGAEIYALHHNQEPWQMDLYFRDGITLCKKPFLVATMFGCAAVGGLLGLLQILPELKRDRWAALLHRPVSRGQFFWGKAVAGLLLYLLAAGVPFLVSVWFVATPGNFATPFVPEMIRPGLADLAAGAAYYFAALAVALHGGHIVLRLLPLFAALHVSFFALDEKLFRVALEAALSMALALCLAGWGAIHDRESLRSRPWMGRIAFLIVAFYGACGAGDLAKSLGGILGRAGDQKKIVWQVLAEGAPARLAYVNDVVVAATDAEGKPFAERKYQPDQIRSHSLWPSTTSLYIGDSHGWRPRRDEAGYRESSSYLSASSPFERPRFEQWFHLKKENRYVGFLPDQKVAFASLGSSGFAPADSKAPGFAEGVDGNQFDRVLAIGEGEVLRYAFLTRREIKSIALPAPGPIFGTTNAWARRGTGGVNFLGVALGAGVTVYDAKGGLVAMLPYHHDTDRWGAVSLGVDAEVNRFILQYEPSAWIDENRKKSMPSYVETLDAKGNVLASFTLPPLPPAVNPPQRSTLLAQRMQSPAFFFGEMLYRKIGAALGSERLRDALAKQFGSDLKMTREAGTIIVLIAASLAGVTFFWARRAQLPRGRARLWTASVLVFGLPGFIVFWLAGERPRTVRCASCRLPRRINETHCAHCAAGWPEIVSAGTEIFDPTP